MTEEEKKICAEIKAKKEAHDNLVRTDAGSVAADLEARSVHHDASELEQTIFPEEKPAGEEAKATLEAVEAENAKAPVKENVPAEEAPAAEAEAAFA